MRQNVVVHSLIHSPNHHKQWNWAHLTPECRGNSWSVFPVRKQGAGSELVKSATTWTGAHMGTACVKSWFSHWTTVLGPSWILLKFYLFSSLLLLFLLLIHNQNNYITKYITFNIYSQNILYILHLFFTFLWYFIPHTQPTYEFLYHLLKCTTSLLCNKMERSWYS